MKEELEKKNERTIAGKRMIFKKILNPSPELSLVFTIEKGFGSGLADKISKHHIAISPLRIDASHYEILVTTSLILPTDLRNKLIEEAFRKIQEAIEKASPKDRKK